jgi:flagellar export protein FliJ
MKQFHFRLESVLRLEQARLEAEQRKLHLLLAEGERLQAEFEGLGQERAQAGKFLEQTPGGIGTLELRVLSGFLLGLRARGITLRERLEAVSRAADEQRERVLCRERKVRLLENLRARKFAEWKQEYERELEAVAQDAWNAAHLRKRDLMQRVKKRSASSEKTEEVKLPLVAG